MKSRNTFLNLVDLCKSILPIVKFRDGNYKLMWVLLCKKLETKMLLRVSTTTSKSWPNTATPRRSYVMLCYVMLCYVMLCYVMLCCVELCCVVLCCVVFCRGLYNTYVKVNKRTYYLHDWPVTPLCVYIVIKIHVVNEKNYK